MSACADSPRRGRRATQGCSSDLQIQLYVQNRRSKRSLVSVGDGQHEERETSIGFRGGEEGAINEMDHAAVPASAARPPAASNPTARRSPGTTPGISSSSVPRRRSHRRSRSDGSAEISAALLSSSAEEIAHTSATTSTGVQLSSAAELPAGAEAATEVPQQLIRPRKLPKPKAPWRKVLYEQQPYEDNHVDQAFLSMLITNQNVVILEFWEVVKVRVQSSCTCSQGQQARAQL